MRKTNHTLRGVVTTLGVAISLAMHCPAQAGSLDTTFGTGGKVTTDFGGSSIDAARDILAMQADGKVIVAGMSYGATTGNDFALARYNIDGSLDLTFGNAGSVTTHFGYWEDIATSVVIQPDGRIVAAGYTSTAMGGYDFALARYHANGSLDASFDTDGMVTTGFGSMAEQAEAVAIQADGKIVIAGWRSDPSTNTDFALVRYHMDGSLDLGFGNLGIVTTHFGYGQDTANSVAIQADGKIVAAGFTLMPTGYYDFALARYNADGSLDTDFDGDGMVTTPVGLLHDIATAVAIQIDGKIVAGGSTGLTAGWREVWRYDFALVRYNVGGSLDTTFGNGGKVTTSFGGFSSVAFDVVIQGDGIVAAGYSSGDASLGSLDFAVARYDANGNLDPTFGAGGLVTTDFDQESDRAWAVALQAGKILLAGDAWTGTGGYDFAMARYLGFTNTLDLLESLAQQVEGLAAASILNHGQARSLQAKIEAAILQVDRGKYATAINVLEAFLREVSALIGNVLPQPVGQLLYDQAAFIITLLS